LEGFSCVNFQDEPVCRSCYDNAQERAYDRIYDDGECFRGGEAESYRREQQEKARRLK
jgi:hypothetical protein